MHLFAYLYGILIHILDICAYIITLRPAPLVAACGWPHAARGTVIVLLTPSEHRHTRPCSQRRFRNKPATGRGKGVASGSACLSAARNATVSVALVPPSP